MMIPSLTDQKRLADKLKADYESFLARGGKVRVASQGESGNNSEPLLTTSYNNTRITKKGTEQEAAFNKRKVDRNTIKA